jgi:hypothetical protein
MTAERVDRYDDLMLGLYLGVAPDWLSGTQRDLFLRESQRRRCELALKLRRLWPCATYLARCVHSDDFALQVFRALPDNVSPSVDMTTALYLGLDNAFRSAGGPTYLHELFTYESLAVDLACVPRGERLAGNPTVFRFDHDIQAVWGRISMYSTAVAPAEFARSYVPSLGPTFIARLRRGDKWILSDVTDEHAPG